MKVKTITQADEIHITQVRSSKTVQIRFGPEEGMPGRGSRTIWLSTRDARIFAHNLLAETERIVHNAQQARN